ncbi:MAG: STAS domain-containing protein [Solirubrobacteraceae bacterium]
MKPSLFEIDADWDGETVRLTTRGELDLATSPQLEQEMRTILARGAQRVTIDLSGLTFVDSSGLRVLIVLHERSKQDGWELALLAPSNPARAVFRISGAEEHLPFVQASSDGHRDGSQNLEGAGELKFMTSADTDCSKQEEDPPFVEENLA